LRTYETLYIIKPDVPEDEVQTLAKQLETLVASDGGEIVRSEIWGKRRLAYEVKKFSEGYYVLLRFTGNPGIVQRIESHFHLADAVIRHLLVLFDERTLRLEANQKKRKEAELRAAAANPRRRDEDSDDEDDGDFEPRYARRGGRRRDDDEDRDEEE